MNPQKSIILILFLLFSQFLVAQIPEGYYNSTEGLHGESLKSALHNIIKGHTEFPYTSSSTDTWDILKESDKDTANPENVILFYSGWTVDAAQEYNDNTGWSREHVWAKSHGDFDTDTGVGTDVHNLKPSDITVNSARNNKDFDNGGTQYIDGDGETACYSDADSWEPRDAVKGDVARILFYMATRYEGENGEPDLELVDQVDSYDLNEPGKGYHGKVNTLLQWHYDDPVDSFEIRRNNIIYSYQNNRNPFIDHPEFVESIWNIDGTSAKDLQKDEILFYPNPASEYIVIENLSGEKIQGEIYTMSGRKLLSFTRKGQRRIRITNLESGSYIIRINYDKKFYSDTLIIVK